jgi:hypothetical protein
MTGHYPLDLILFDFHVWGYMRDLVYRTTLPTVLDTSWMVLPSCGKIMKTCRQEHAALKQACVSATNTGHFTHTCILCRHLQSAVPNTSFCALYSARNTCMLLTCVCRIAF